MIEIEKIFPYTIVSNDDSKYGIVDNKGNIVVPFEMDDIENISDEEIGLEMWEDYNCVCLVRDGMLGFFTNNGKYIEPAYLNYTVDPCGGDIHVETLDGYGVLRYPKYILEEIPAESSLLNEITEDDEFEDFEELDEFEDDGGFDLTLNQDIVDEGFEAGYKHAEAYMANFDATRDDMSQYIEQMYEDLPDVTMTYAPFNGAAAYLTEKYVGKADITKLNQTFQKFSDATEADGYYALFRTIDRLLPHPEDTEDCVISFSEGNRPTFTSPDVRGEIGDIYLYEHGMHMFYVSANIYDSNDPDELIEECCILNVDNIVLSELLACLQNEIDPGKTNKELADNILKAANLEGGHKLGHILTDCGIHMLKTEDTYVHWWDSETLCDMTGYMNSVYVSDDGSLNMVITDSDNFPTSAEIYSTNPCLTTILAAIRKAANLAWANMMTVMKDYYLNGIDNEEYTLYYADDEVLSPEGNSIVTTSEKLGFLLLEDAQEYDSDCENPLSILSYHALYCDLLQQEEDKDDDNIEMLNNLIHVDYFWAFDEPRQIRAAALSQYLDSLPKYINDLPLHQHAAYINLMAATGSILLPHKIVSNLLSEDSQYSPNDFDGFIETLESYGKETGASENIDVDWTFDSIKKMVKTFITYYTLEKV